MKQLKRRMENQKLTVQIGSILFILFLGATIGNACLLYQNNMNMYISEEWQQALQLGNYAGNNLEDTEVLDWLLDYWIVHAKELDITYDDPEATKKRAVMFHENYPQYELTCITQEDIESMPDMAKKAYAEYYYMKMTDDFNRIKRIYHPTYLFCFYPKSDTELFYFVTGTEEGEVRGDHSGFIYQLGTISNYDIADYPVLKRTWETGEVQDELEQPVKTGELSGYYHTYVPIVKNGKTICLIGVTLETNTVKREIQQRVLRIEIAEACVFFLIGVLVFCVLHIVFVKPVRQLATGMRQYEEEKNFRDIRERLSENVSKSEMGQLTKRFMELTVAIDRHVEEITKITQEQQKLKTELSFAAGIQLAMLPSIFPPFPDKKEFDIYATMTPAKEVGGDFYDFFLIDEDHLALVMADVSGKGVPAALFMVIAKTMIKNRALMGGSPAEILGDVNEQLCKENKNNMFVTVWLGILELSTGKGVAANAGHEDPAIRRQGQNYELVKTNHSLVMAALEGIRFKEYEFELHPGDCLYIYTDGVPEATDRHNELFGNDRMLAALNRNPEASPMELLHNVKKEMDLFVGDAPQFDDITMLVIAFWG